LIPRKLGFLATLVLLVSALHVLAEIKSEWITPFPAFRIAPNLYYVGSQDLAAYLIVTPQGDILINSNLESSPQQIKKSIESLGFHMSDVKILLISHAHYDHCGGSAEILRETHAKYEVMAQDVPVIEAGGHNDFNYASDKTMWFPPAHVDRVLHDGDTVSLGGVTLTAHLTAGHTKGTTTWTCDLFLGAHGAYFNLAEKYARFHPGERNTFIDPAGYQAYIADREHAFEAELKKQSAAQH
jgi:metallo-beta-lactamase class B